MSEKEKITIFVDADVFVTPSFSGFPVTFLEACACSTPIITTNKGDELDWIHNKVGYVVEYNKYLKHDPGNARVRYKKGLVLLKGKSDQAAIREFQKVIDKDPAHAPAFQGLGQASRRNRRSLFQRRSRALASVTADGVAGCWICI